MAYFDGIFFPIFPMVKIEESFNKLLSPDPYPGPDHLRGGPDHLRGGPDHLRGGPDPDHLRGGSRHGCNTSCVKKSSQSEQ